MKGRETTRIFLLKRLQVILSVVSLLALISCRQAPQPNTLTKAEQNAGWRLLFDGTTTTGWRKIHAESFPAEGWEVQGGCLTAVGLSREKPGAGGSIITIEEFGDFELSFEFDVEEATNSGIKYYVVEELNDTPGRGLGLEYQIWDDAKARDDNKKLAALYDLIPASNKVSKPYPEFNEARISSRKGHVEHWLNGVKVVEFERGSDAYRTRVANSKYKNIANFGEAATGHILLQDEGPHTVRFRNIKIRTFDN